MVVFGAAIAAPAMAQDNFPDVPENHWAYDALENLKREGILVGYRDGTYKGPRDLTRYELAVALNAAYQRLKTMYDGLAGQVSEIRAGMGRGGDGNTAGLEARLKAVEDQLRGMSKLNDDVAAMKKMADEFQKELASLGVDVEALKKDLAEMGKRMGGTTAGGIQISGDANVIIHAGEGTDGTFAMGIDGRIVGANDAGTARVGLYHDLNVYHEIATTISSGSMEGPKWDATLVYGNLLGTAGASATSGYGNQSDRFGGQTFREGAGDFYIQSFKVELANEFGGLPFKAHVGRLGAQTTNPYLFKRRDNTPYFSNERWDNGNWMFDGAILAFNFGETSSLTIMGGRNANRRSANGVELQPIATVNGESSIGSTIGAEAKIGLGDTGAISLAYLLHSENNSGAVVNPLGAADRLEVYGGSINFGGLKGFKIDAGYGKALLKDGSASVNDDDNQAYYVNVGLEGNKNDIKLGYRKVESNYIAAGNWNRIGTNWSPTNIETFHGSASFGFGENATLKVMGEFGDTINTVGGIPADSKITNLGAKLTYNMNEFFKIMGGYEYVKVDFNASANEIKQTWFTLGFGYNMSKNSMFNLVYQNGDVQNGAAWGAGPAGNFKGHILTSQLSIKF